ncbi:MAG: hypothetical protein KDE03_14065 [Rhodobacteraceae bacterium]|nr:hypothetical protein [Paracoccaceae bacterium]
MTRIAALFLATALIFSPAGAAFARPLAGAEAEAMDKALNSYLAAIGRNDAEKIVAAFPPRILNVFAGATGIEAKKLTETLVAQTAELMKGIKVGEVAAKPGPLEVTDTVLADGVPVVWGLVSTSFVSETATGKARNNQPLLAVSEGGAWYFLRVDGAERRQLAALAYPFLAGVEIPDAVVTPLN